MDGKQKMGLAKKKGGKRRGAGTRQRNLGDASLGGLQLTASDEQTVAKALFPLLLHPLTPPPNPALIHPPALSSPPSVWEFNLVHGEVTR